MKYKLQRKSCEYSGVKLPDDVRGKHYALRSISCVVLGTTIILNCIFPSILAKRLLDLKYKFYRVFYLEMIQNFSEKTK